MKACFVLISVLLLSTKVLGQISANDLPFELQRKPWPAQWIAPPGIQPKAIGVYHFRKIIDLPQKPESFVVHVSGDNRYKFFVNGQLVSLGPARSDVQHWHFETVDLAAYLKAGSNVLAAVTWNFGELIPFAQHTLRSGFLLQGNTPREYLVNTDTSWRCQVAKAYSVFENDLNTFFEVGPGEQLDFAQYPWGWQSAGFDDSTWERAVPIIQATMWHRNIGRNNWTLTPRAIPPMEYTPQRIARVRLTQGISVPKGFPEKAVPLKVGAYTQAVIILDQEVLTTAYPVLKVSGGKDAKITISYAESLFEPKTEGLVVPVSKGQRGEVEGKVFFGYSDIFLPDGGMNREISPLWWRTYRYIELKIETQAAPCTVEDVYGMFTAYPLRQASSFRSSNPKLSQMLDMGWRTARLCANETYMDCPYYEQLQYAGDVRIQAMVTLYNSPDDRLVRNAIRQLSYSLSANGLTMSRYPSYEPQFIPTFSIWWIGMLHDYWQYRGDTAFVSSFLPTTRMILHYFLEKQHADGSLRLFPDWPFTDWAKHPTWEQWGSIAPYTPEGRSAPLDLQLLMALQMAKDLEQQVGLTGMADFYQEKIVQLRKTLRQLYWDSNRGLFADTPEKKDISQHANLLAVLTEMVTGMEAQQLMEKVLTDKDLVQVSIFFKYYLHLAAAKTGFGDRYLDLLGMWYEQMDLGLTTWAETFEPSRSDCHAWGASPNVEFFRIVLGIDTDAPGFQKVKIAPHLGALREVSGSIPHPAGKLSVSYRMSAKGGLEAEIALPKGVTGTFHWKGQSKTLVEGRQVFNFQ